MQALRYALRHPRFPLLLGLFLAGAASLPTLRYAWHRIGVVRGWEADIIARSLVGGHGFSFTNSTRWLFDNLNGSETTWHPTAWMDPVYTYLLAGAHWAFGGYAYPVMYAINFLCIGLVLAWSWRLAERFGGPWAGAVVIVLLSANKALGRSIFDSINNTTFSAAAVTAGALVTVRYFQKPDRARLLQLGLYTGFMILSCPAIQYFLPLLAVALFVLHWRDRVLHWQRPIVVLLLSLSVIGPWTLRNYLTFGELVPVRNGAGQIAWDGTVGAASTFALETTGLVLPPPWRSEGPRDAIQNLLKNDKRYPMHGYQVKSTVAQPPAGYEGMNEAQRDKFYLQAAKAFMLREPAIAANLAIAKLEAFVMRFGIYGLGTFLLALLGALLLMRDRRAWPLMLMAVAYTAPFAVAVPYFGRYRAPIEPVIAVLGAVAVSRILSVVKASIRGRMSPSGDPAEPRAAK